LAAGLVVGLAIRVTQSAAFLKVVPAIETMGTVWVGLLTMTVIPLVVSLLITGIASASESGKLGRLAGQAMLIFLVLYMFAAVLTLLVSPFLFTWLAVDHDTIALLRDSMHGGADGRLEPLPGVREQIVAAVPTNPVKAAAQGEILALVVFSIMFGLAITRVASESRQVLVRFFQGLAEAMLVIVRWLLVIAPVGIFAVVLPLVARLGFEFVGALAYYVVILSALCVIFTLALYPIVSFFGHIPGSRFARASAPAQSVALGTQSSLASLPAMIQAAEERLRLSPRATGVVLPLAVSVFRFSTPIWLIVASFFVAQLYDIALTPAQIGTVGVMSVVMSIGGVGLPSGASYFGPITPVFLSIGLPVEAIAVLFAVDTIPDMVETVSNVTADLAAAAIVSARAGTFTVA
jgi:Na+/H+-dicarboxylate symporter